MKYAAAAVALFITFAVQAAPVTITFDDPGNETYFVYPDPLVGTISTAERAGFLLEGLYFVGPANDRALATQAFENFWTATAYRHVFIPA